MSSVSFADFSSVSLGTGSCFANAAASASEIVIPLAIVNCLKQWQDRLAACHVGDAIFGLLRFRLKNAKRYLDSGEFGACKFELDLIPDEISRLSIKG